MTISNSQIAFLRGELDAEQYWLECAQPQLESAGVFLGQDQQARILKQLTRLVTSLREVGFVANDPAHGLEHQGVEAANQLFDACLAKYR